MKADIKKQWIEALRSGKYTQGQEYLFRDGKHCCLGVLGEVCGIPREELDGMGLTPIEALKLFDYKHMSEVVAMNDSQDQKSFREIADWIEANVETSS